MASNKYFISLFIGLFALSGTGALAFWAFTQPHLIVAPYILLGLWLSGTGFVFYHLRHTLGTLQQIRASIEQGEKATITPIRNPFGQEFRRLIAAMNTQITNTRQSKAEQYHLLKHAVDQSAAAILVYTLNGQVQFCNHASCKLFRQDHIATLEGFGKIHPQLKNLLLKESSFMLPVVSKGKFMHLSARCNPFTLGQNKLIVASINNIATPLAHEEVAAWKKLLHIISHEIINSITPIKTLSWSLLQMHKQIPPGDTDNHQSDTMEALTAIHERMQGLMGFVQSYRQLYKLPTPNPALTNTREIIQEVKQLFNPTLNNSGVKLIHHDTPAIELQVDKQQIQQILLNLLKNAFEACHENDNPEIDIKVDKTDTETTIKITDNGNGIPKKILPDIFIPFYTTKDKGNGIGLYLSRLIAFNHKGNITCNSCPGKTQFALSLPNP